MAGYNPKFWKHGENVTAGEFCEYVKANIPSNAILHVCGNSQVYLHLSADRKVLSLDDCALSDLDEYMNCEVGKLETKATIVNL